MEGCIKPTPSKNQHNILDVFPKTLIKHRTLISKFDTQECAMLACLFHDFFVC